ncbi:MAG: hypothetical protein INF43_04080, partial [Alphaproteobacteria bacterium]|nr:hypothetical protein [Alphaproteobacteria bacterium]
MEQPIEVLSRLRGYFESAVQAPAYLAWRQEAKLAWDFYDGSQWAPEEVAKLAEVGQPAIVINKIAAKIDNVAGTEVAGRTRIVFRSRSGQVAEEQAAQVLTDLLTYTAERTELPHELSRAFRAGLVCGIGWLEVGSGPEPTVRAEDELAVVWDPLAQAADLADARFVARERWLEAEAVREFFPDHGPALMAALREEGSLLRGPYQQVAAPLLGSQAVPYYDGQRELYRVVELQYKRSVRQWRVQQLNGRVQGYYSRTEAKAAAARGQEELAHGRADLPRVVLADVGDDKGPGAGGVVEGRGEAQVGRWRGQAAPPGPEFGQGEGVLRGAVRQGGGRHEHPVRRLQHGAHQGFGGVDPMAAEGGVRQPAADHHPLEPVDEVRIVARD